MLIKTTNIYLVITIRQILFNYSPWIQKIMTMNNYESFRKSGEALQNCWNML